MNIKASLLYARKLIFPKSSKFEAKSNAHKSLIGAMICIGISLIPLVAVLVVSDGMIEGITGRMIGLSTRDMCVYIGSRSSSVESAESLRKTAADFEKVEGIEKAFPEVQGIGLAANKSKRTGATIRAVQNNVFTEDENFSKLFDVIDGYAVLEEKNECIIGSHLADLLSLKAGDSLKLLTINSNTRTNIKPKVSVLNIKAIVSSGYQELDALWVFIPLEKGFEILPESSSKYTIGIKTKDAFASDLYKIQYRLQQAIAGHDVIDCVEYAYVYRWDELNTSEYENFQSTKALLLIIMLLIVLVASVNISSALVMLVMERRKEIAILKSTGASSSGIATAFLITGFAAGFGGTVIGIPLGLLASVNINGIIAFMEKAVNLFAKFGFLLTHSNADSFVEIHLLDPSYYLQNIPVNIHFDELMVIAVGTLVLSVLVSAVPAIKAGKEKPLDTLRKM